MELITESYETSDSILIVAKGYAEFVELLRRDLNKYNAQIHIKEQIPEDIEKYEVCFFINPIDMLPSDFGNAKDKKYVFIFIDEEMIAQTFSSFAYDHGYTHIRVILIQSQPEHYKKDIETLLWFSFSRTNDIYLHIYHPDPNPFPKKVKKNRGFKIPTLSFAFIKKPRFLITVGIIFLLLTHLLFIPPLLMSSYYHYSITQNLSKGDARNMEQNLQKAYSLLSMARSLYSFPQGTFHLFSIAFYIEDLFHINESAHKALTSIMRLQKEGQEFASYISLPDKTEEETLKMYKQKELIFEDIKILHSEISYLKEKIPTWERTQHIKVSLDKANQWLSLAESIEHHIDTFFAKGTEKKYLLLFANNMELRPGGGFIGSFAILTLKDYSIKDLQVYDVYDADGQLEEQIDPPEPIVEYLNQTHWYLRDSAFSPDFVDNFLEAESFVEKEIGEDDFEGGILLTTTAVQHLLQAMDRLYIPDYQETITKDNFYIKTQLHAEEDFFPGSTQKKSFLKSVLNQMILGLSDASLPRLLEMTEKSLNEKQMVIYSRDGELQAFIEENFWSGKLLKPQCNKADATNCILDFVYTLDANLGVNKANFYIQRPTSLTSELNESGTLTNTLTIQYRNDSYTDIFPGGSYKNYFQVLLPPNTQVTSVQIDDKRVAEYEETNFSYKKVAFFMEVPPQSTRMVKVTYKLPITVIKGKGLYQLIFQKQVGAPNYDFKFNFIFPESVKITNKNLSPLVKDNEINYNTSISSDKIFVIEFTKN